MTKSNEDELRRLTKSEQAELDRAQAALARAKAKRNAAAMAPARQKIQDIEERVRRRIVSAQRQADRAETIALAKARGEEVDDKGRVTRILTRQGIQQAYEKGLMTPRHGPLNAEDLYATAKAYRDAFEALEGRTTTGGGGTGQSGATPQLRIIQAGEALATMRVELSPFQVDVLNHVCGLDMRVHEARVILRRGYPAMCRALVSGLEQATRNMRAARVIRTKGEKVTPDKIRDAVSQIATSERTPLDA